MTGTKPTIKADGDVAAALARLREGKMVLLLDEDPRTTGADLLLGAEFADTAAINFMAREGRGLVSLALSGERCEELGLQAMPSRGASRLAGQAMMSIESREGVTTGISAADRALTIAKAADPSAGPEDFVIPGHVVPLRARPAGNPGGGGRIEAAVAAVAAAGLPAAAAICEVIGEDGGVPDREALEFFATRHELTTASVAAVLAGSREATPQLGVQVRQVIGRFAAGIAAVTGRRPDGSAVGAAAIAIASVSLEPPLLLACLTRNSETLAVVRTTGRFAVNMLRRPQGTVQGVVFEDNPFDVPVLSDALARITCEVADVHPAGDHEIVVGHVRAVSRPTDSIEPLFFHRGSYGRLELEEDQLLV